MLGYAFEMVLNINGSIHVGREMIVLLFHPQKFYFMDFLGLYSLLFLQGAYY